MIFYRKNWRGEQIEVDVPEEHLFLGGCKGVCLEPRGEKDPHICFRILTEDDGMWFESNNAASIFWLDDLQKQIHRAQKWVEENAVKEGYGYRFK